MSDRDDEALRRRRYQRPNVPTGSAPAHGGAGDAEPIGEAPTDAPPPDAEPVTGPPTRIGERP